MAGGGWVCRDHQGRLLRAQGFTLTASSALMSEALAMQSALSYALSLARIWIEADSVSLIPPLLSPSSALSSLQQT